MPWASASTWPNAATADGTRVQIATCNGNAAQQWTYTGAHDLVNPQANKCLDVTGNNSANGNPDPDLDLRRRRQPEVDRLTDRASITK